LPVSPSWWTDQTLQERIAAAVPRDIGHVAVAIRHLRTGASVLLDADAVMPPASLFKLGVMVEAFRQIESGALALDEALLLTWDDWAEGSGVLQGRIGNAVSVSEALRLMIGLSDNTAALALLRRLDADAVNAGYARLGLPHSHYYTDWRPDTTTAAETASLLALIAGGQAVGGVATRHMLELMAQDQPQAWIREALPPGTPVAHKSGQLPGVRNDAAIVYGPDGPYVIVVLAEDLSDEADGESIIGTIAGEVHAYFVALDKGKPLLVLP
jgi:beta-lactamase class A